MGFKSIKVLVVDDSKVMRRIISQHLHSIDIQVVYEASSGRGALDVLAENRVDLILSDWSMPGLSGLDFLKEVRQQTKNKDIPFILLTAEAQLYTILLAFEACVSSYITKPFTPDYFRYIVHRVLKEAYAGPCEI
jgi:two-component system chemotaxis response regulator CheY